MLKKGILAVIAIFIAWSILNFLVHGLVLGPEYEATVAGALVGVIVKPPKGAA